MQLDHSLALTTIGVVSLALTACRDPDSSGNAFDTAGPTTADSMSSTTGGGGTDDTSSGTGASSSDSGAPATTGADTDEDPKFDVGDGNTSTAGDGSGGCGRMDLLFVMDISASMSEETDNLRNNFDDFIQVLDDHIAASNDFTSYRIGVTNSSINRDFGGCATTLGLNGNLFAQGCGLGSDPWIEGPGPDVATQFACLADDPSPGTGIDCGNELPLETTELFGDKLGPGQPNEGFYSKDANSLLVVVIATDEDETDTSLTTPAMTKSYLDALTGGEERYGAIVIAGPGPGECEGAYGDAEHAVVLEEFAGLVPNGVFGSICQGDLAQTLKAGLADMVVSCDELPPPQG